MSAAQFGSRHGDRRRWIALIVVCLAMLMSALDSSIVNVALPTIQRNLHFSQANLTWVIDAYLITFGSFLLLAGRLGDLVGRKRVFLAGIGLFTVSSALCGLAPDQGLLVAGRFLQGAGGALSASVILAIIITEFPQPAERAKAMSAYICVAVGGAAAGLLVGGVITQSLGWHWIFFINLPIGVGTFVLGRALIEENEGLGISNGVDIAGSVLVTGALMVAIYAVVTATTYGWLSTHTLGFGAAALAMGGLFVALEGRLENPIMPLRILRLRTLTASSVIRGLLSTGMFATFFLGALYFERVLHYDAMKTGLAFLPLSAIVATLSLGITARLVTRFGPVRVLMTGMVALIAGLLLLASCGLHAHYLSDIFPALVLTAFGAGTSFLPLLTLAMTGIPKDDAGLASGIVNVSMQMSAAVGLAVLGALASDRTQSLLGDHQSQLNALIGGYHLSFLVGAGFVVVGLILAPVLLRGHGATPEDDPLTAREIEAMAA
jgi:EmrB/QacA subfamily drug resistance transporter